MKHFKTISEFHEFRDLPKPQHPLLSVINVADVRHLHNDEPMTLAMDFYSIAIKRMSNVIVKYGQHPFDFNEGIMSFMAPKQVFSIELSNKNEAIKQSGWVMYIHPDFLWNTTLAKTIKGYDFWSYSLREALFLSEKEEEVINIIIQNINREYHSNIDKFSKQIIISQIESLLNYADRFYHRQFITGSNYAQAIQQSNVKRVVYLSSWGAHLDKGTGIILGSHNVEVILNALSGVALTHLRAGSFFYNLYGFVNMIKGAGFIGANYGGDDKIVWAAPTDIAAAAAEELQKIPIAGSNVRYVASDERTATETANVLGAAIGKPDLQWITFTDEQAKTGMEQNGIPPGIAADLVDLNASIHNGTMGEDYELNKPTMMGKIKVEDFAKEFAAAFEEK